ncbi:MAG: hypothetical protein ACLUD2_20520 [Clostridium sp.]
MEEDASTFFVIEDSREHVTSTPPTRLKNPALLRPFEDASCEDVWPPEAYNEFDPTLLIAVTYSLFFGFMFGDVGQGAFAPYRRRFLSFTVCNDAGPGGHHFLAVDSRSTIFGFLFGSVFGFEARSQPSGCVRRRP